MAKAVVWKDLTPQQKIARLKKQQEEIQAAHELLDEFSRLTADWIKKVEALDAKKQAAK